MTSDANRIAIERIAACEPVLTGIDRASRALGLEEMELGHAGPPFRDPSEIPPLVLNALAGAAVHEGWAADQQKGRRLVRSGAIRLHANHDLGTVSPMAGIVRPSQQLIRVDNRAGDGRTWATLAEAGRRALRFGVYDTDAAVGLRHVDDVVAPAIASALPPEGLPVWPLVAQGICQGDDVHQRNIGGMAAFLTALPDLPADIRRWLSSVPQHFLNYAMAAAKLCLDQASGIEGASIVTAITRNGVDCAIRVAGCGNTWFRAPASGHVGGFFDGFSAADAQRDLGDSAIVEAMGLGGAMAHCAPEIARTMQTDWVQAQREGRHMRSLFVTRAPWFDPALAAPDGIGLGLCARAAAQAGGVRIHTGIGHRDGATGWIGIGLARAPAAAFAAATEALDNVTPNATATATPPVPAT